MIQLLRKSLNTSGKNRYYAKFHVALVDMKKFRRPNTCGDVNII